MKKNLVFFIFAPQKQRKKENLPLVITEEGFSSLYSWSHDSHEKTTNCLKTKKCTFCANLFLVPTYMRYFFLFLWCLAFPALLFAQYPGSRNSAIKNDTTPSRIGVRGVKSNPLGKDSIKVNRTNLDSVSISKDGLDKPFDYSAKDSIEFDNANELVHLYGDATIKYEKIELTAAYILLDMKNSIATAEMRMDSTGKRLTGQPTFKGEGQNLKASKLRYNFKTHKGVVSDAATQQQNMYVVAEKTRFVGKEAAKDTTDAHDVIYNGGAILTTCNAPHPHFGIYSSKQKIVADKAVIIGRSSLDIGGVRLPIIPFGVFPLSKLPQSKGLIFPQNFENSRELGFGLKNVGYYFPINDNWDATVTGDAYIRGSWAANVNTNYYYRYRCRGSVRLSYSRQLLENEFATFVPRPSFGINITHNQDASARPNQTFGGSINIQTNNFQSRTNNSSRAVLANTLSSNFSYSRSFPDWFTPGSLSIALNHSQNTKTRDVVVSLPNVDFRLNRFNPFKVKERAGAERWYERLSVTTSANFQNKFTAKDSTLFTRKTLQSAQLGAQVRADAEISFKLLKYISFTPRVSYSQNMYFNFVEKQFNPNLFYLTKEIKDVKTGLTRIDTTTTIYGKPDTIKHFGLRNTQTFSANAELNTTIYGTRQFKSGYVRGIRHRMTPSVSFQYTPAVDSADLYYRRVQYTNDSRVPKAKQLQSYSELEGGAYGIPSIYKTQMGLNFSLSNNFEIKTRGKRDTVDKKRPLLETVGLSTFYNFAEDSLRWRQITWNTGTRLFKSKLLPNGLTTVTINGSFDPYQRRKDTLGRFQRVNQFVWNKENKFKIAQFERMSMSFYTGMTIKELRGIFQKKEDTAEKNKKLKIPKEDKPSFGVEEGDNKDKHGVTNFLDILDEFSFTHSMNFEIEHKYQSGKDTFKLTNNNLSFRGRIPLTKNWAIEVSNIAYDFTEKRLVYPDISFTRDMHCWEMRMGWQPERGTYTFMLRAKQAPLDFLKVPYNKNNIDSRFGR
ncbi:MAG: hypothetical protein RLZZ292_1407 [Bacteroidota bacterium]